MMSALSDAQLFKLNPIPVLSYAWPDGVLLAAELKQVILARMRETRGVKITNVGGWHSGDDLQNWPYASVEDLKSRVVQMVREMVHRNVATPRKEHLEGWRIQAWANVSGRGASNRSHDHMGAQNMWSGIFYVDAGGIDASLELGGLTKFEDHSKVPKEIVVNPDPFEREFTVVPQVGLMVLFPASLRHFVQPYHGANQRITIAFNLSHDGFVIPLYQDDALAQDWWHRNFRGVMVGLDRVKALVHRERNADAGRSMGVALKRVSSP